MVGTNRDARHRAAEETLERIRELGRGRSLVIVDDDPTGTQTTRGVDILTSWSDDVLAERIDSGAPFFVLTNSRSLPVRQAIDLAAAIGRDLAAAEARTGRAVSVISRSDSTLRGHFPAEVDALATGLGRPDSRVVLAPYLGEAGRITVDDMQLIRIGDDWRPVAETEFASDPTFGYRAANLRDWVVERGAGGRPLASVSLDSPGRSGAEFVRTTLADLPPGGICIVNAANDAEIDTVALGVLEAECAGTSVIARTAASYVRARIGQARQPVLDATQLRAAGPGLVVVGSHVATTTAQLESLLAAIERTRLVPVEMNVRRIVSGDAPSQVGAAINAVEAAHRAGRSAVAFTSRDLVRAGDRRTDLDIAALVSSALVQVVAGLRRRPGWIVAKGGITGYDLASRALAMRQATVVGQAALGVSVWRSGPGSRWPGLPYVVFPGNVGTPATLRDLVDRLVGP
jgi:uncharacterized protein YgbK (DUF1537 family)